MKKNVFFLLMVFIASTTSFLTGCQNNEMSSQEDITQVNYSQSPSLSKNKEVQDEINFLIKSGKITKDDVKNLLWTTSVQDANGNPIDPMLQGYGLSGTDLGLGTRMGIQEQMKHETNSSLLKHSKTACVSRSGVIKVRMFASVSSSWKTAIIAACDYWNSKGYTVSFSPYSTTLNSAVNGEINVMSGGITNDYSSYVRTQPPNVNGGNPGLAMTINTNCSAADPVVSAKKHAITHELGHVLGFGHTDVLDSGTNWITNSSLPSICRTGTDSSSIMKSTMNSYYAFNGFTTCDNAVFDVYYGDSLA